MHKFFILAILLTTISASAQQAAPGGVDGPRIWRLSEHTAEGKVAWRDQISGTSIDPARGGAQANLNFNPSWYFDGVSEGIHIPLSGFSPAKQTLFTVYQSQDAFSEKSIWHYSIEGTTHHLLTTHRLADLRKPEYMNFPAYPAGYPTINTFLQHQEETEQSSAEISLNLAALPPDHQLPLSAFQGQLPELILYDRMLAPKERQQVESYLAIKYGASLTTGSDYLNSAGQVIFSSSGDFVHRIAGIGRDDLSGLHQKQSGSSYVPGQLVISAGAQAIDNPSNTATLPDRHFLLWADNDQPFEWTDKQPLQPLNLQHQWLVTASGQWSEIPTEVRFDTKWLRSPAQAGETYWLVIDRSGKGDLSPGNELAYFPLTQLSADGKASFQQLHWDTDGSGQDVFTIAAGPELMVNAQLDLPQCDPAKTGSISLSALGGRPPYRFRLRSEEGYVKSWSNNDHQAVVVEQLPPGHYTLSITDKDQKTFREDFFFQSADAPAITLAQRYQLPAEGMLQLNAAGPSTQQLQYRWQTPAGQVIHQPQIHIKTPGDYHLQVQDQGCAAEQLIRIEKAREGNFRRVELYPNPSSDGHFRLRVHLEQAAEMQLRIFDAAGKPVFQQQFEAADYYHTGRQLTAKGAYLVQLRSAGSQITLPLIIQ